ncbi:MAG: hypothetical protein WDO24_19780 [Pseudomonadota bacterium]
MSVVSNTVASVAPTLVTGDRSPIAEIGTNAVYTRGNEFAQALAKVEPAEGAIDLLQNTGKLATPSAMASLQTLLQAASPASPSQPTGSMAQLQQSLQAGAERLNQASRVALDLKF